MNYFIKILFVSFLCGSTAFALPLCEDDNISKQTLCQGTFTFANEDKYISEFKNIKFNGQGTFTFVDGEKIVGKLENNEFIN